jgi:hypothetical protein
VIGGVFAKLAGGGGRAMMQKFTSSFNFVQSELKRPRLNGTMRAQHMILSFILGLN